MVCLWVRGVVLRGREGFMEILIIRHGEAVENAPGLGDAGRWLTEKGRRVTRDVARWLDKRASRRPTTIWTSGLVRAVQTAEIVAARIDLQGEIVVCPELQPSGDVVELVRRVAGYRGEGPLALVGHEPGLSHFVLQLLGNVSWPGIKKSGVVGIEFKPARAEGELDQAIFRFLLRPKDMEVLKSLAMAEGKDEDEASAA